MSKRVLFIYPWSLSEANGARSVLVAYARALVRRGMTVDCIVPFADAAISGAEDRVLGVFDRVFVPTRKTHTLRTLLDAAGAGCVDQALPSQHGCDPALMFTAATLAANGGYDLIGVHYARLHPIRALLPPDVPVVMFTYDLDAVVAEQESIVFGTPASRYTLAMEADRLTGFDAVTTVGPHDRDRLRAISPHLPVHAAPIPIAASPLSISRPTSGAALLLMSSSAVFHELSLAWFLRHAWPQIRRANPEATLMLAGRICETALRFGLDEAPAIELLGTVPSPAEAFVRADVVIAPYYFGDGVKLKILEALAHGLPVVTTSPGLSNTELVTDRDLLVADDGPGFAMAVTRLLRDPERRARLASNAVRYIETHHSESVADRAVQHVVETAMTSPRSVVDEDLADAAQAQRFIGHLQEAVASALDGASSSSAETSHSHLAEQLRVLLPWTVHRVRASGAKSIAIYGAGTHTRIVLPMWRALDGPTPHSVVVSGRPSERWCGGLPVFALDEFDPNGTDAVVVSSHGYEHAMTAAWQARFPNVPVFSIWSPPAATGGPSVIPPTAEVIPVAPSHAQTLHR